MPASSSRHRARSSRRPTWWKRISRMSDSGIVGLSDATLADIVRTLPAEVVCGKRLCAARPPSQSRNCGWKWLKPSQSGVCGCAVSADRSVAVANPKIWNVAEFAIQCVLQTITSARLRHGAKHDARQTLEIVPVLCRQPRGLCSIVFVSRRCLEGVLCGVHRKPPPVLSFSRMDVIKRHCHVLLADA